MGEETGAPRHQANCKIIQEENFRNEIQHKVCLASKGMYFSLAVHSLREIH